MDRRIFAWAVTLWVLVLGSLGCGSATETTSGENGAGRLAVIDQGETCVSFQRGSPGEVADAKISNRQPGKRFGDKPVASVSHVNGHREYLLLRFDTSNIPQQATITSATLTLWQVNSGRPTSLRAHAITGSWSEGSVTWNGFGSAFDASVAASLEAPGPANPASRTLDISSLVSSWAREPSLNHGLLLQQPDGKTLFDTSESPHADRRPRLDVCYTLASAPPPSATLPSGTSLLLQVVDNTGKPVPGAAISSQNALFPTDSSGHFLFENLQPGHFFARVDALGHTSATVVLELPEGAHAGHQVRLHPLGTPISFQAEQGGVIETEQVRITLPPNAVVDALGQPVTGTVNVTTVPLDPTTQMADMPGPLEGIPARGEIVQLESFFMAEVSLWKEGAPVQLAPGASATLEFLLPDSLASQFQEGDTVPAWWFDLDAGRWREEGAGTVQPSQSHPGKLAWVATVHHFTWWNCDAPWTDKSCVDVLVVDKDGQPVANAQVNASGTSYTGYSSPRYTGPDGRTCIEIKRGGTANVHTGLASLPTSEVVSVTGTSEPTACGSGSCSPITLVMRNVICTPGSYGECPYSGPPDTLGKGLCRAGRQQCNITGTAWSACQGEVLPTSESCQSIFDDDCDGSVNEGCVCAEQEGSPCYGGADGTQGVGICREGVVGCDLFGNVACLGQQLPLPESCLTLEDDDCDGSNECEPVTRGLWRPSDTNCSAVHTLSAAGQGNMVILEGSRRLITKLDGNGQPLWSRLLNAGSAEGITVDGAGNVLVSGSFTGSLSVDGITLTSAGLSIFVLKLSPDGELLWARSFGGDASSGAWVVGIATDSTGHVALSGEFRGNLSIGDRTHSNGIHYPEIYVMKLNGNTGAPLWSRSYGDNDYGDRRIGGVAMDAAGNLLVAGTFFRTFNFGEVVIEGSHLPTNFIAKIHGSTGETHWGRRVDVSPPAISDSGTYRGKHLRVDHEGKLLVLWTAFNLATLMKFDETDELWTRSIGLGYGETNAHLAMDASGNALVAGAFMSSTDFGGGSRGNSFGLPNAFLAWYDANGQYLSDKVFAGWGSADGYGYAAGVSADIDYNGNVVFAGRFSGTMDFGTGPVQATSSCNTFLLKLDPTP